MNARNAGSTILRTENSAGSAGTGALARAIEIYRECGADGWVEKYGRPGPGSC